MPRIPLRARPGALAAALLACAAAPAGAQTGGSAAPETTPQRAGSAPAPSTSEPAPAPAPSAPARRGAPEDTRTVRLTRAEAKRLQRRLRVRADGVIGARTRTALRRYQRRRGLASTGRPNLQTLKAMRLPFAADVERRLGAPPAAPAPPVATGVIQAARSQIGVPYAAAGADPRGFDCSGLTRWAFAQAGTDLPHSSFAQFELGRAVQRAEIRAGDLVFFDTAGPGASDVGIATSPTTVISATTRGVREHQAFDAYWGGHFVGVRRLAAQP